MIFKLYPTRYYTLVLLSVERDNFGISKELISQRWSTLPTVFFMLSAADLQWTELANLLDVDKPHNSVAGSRAVVENRCLTNWFFFITES